MKKCIQDLLQPKFWKRLAFPETTVNYCETWSRHQIKSVKSFSLNICCYHCFIVNKSRPTGHQDMFPAPRSRTNL